MKRNIDQEKVFAKNLEACKHYYNAVAQYMDYHKTNSINAAQMRLITKSLGISNMMPSHFADAGLMRKEKIIVKKRRQIIYSFKHEFITIDQLAMAAKLKMEYVQSVRMRATKQEQEQIQTSMDELCQPQTEPKDGKPVQTQIEFPAQEPQVDSNALKSVVLFLIDNLKKLL